MSTDTPPGKYEGLWTVLGLILGVYCFVAAFVILIAGMIPE